MRQPSNPIMHGLEGRTQQVAEAPVFSPYKDGDGLWSICGRCQSCFPAFDLEFTWGSNKPTKVTVNPDFDQSMPRPDWCYAYDSIRMVRRKIQEVGAAYPTMGSFLLETGPMLTYTSCYWSSQFFGPTRRVVLPSAPAGTPYTEDLNSIINLQWFLFYGNSMGCITDPAPAVPADLSTDQIIMEPLDKESEVTGFGTVPSDNDQNNTGETDGDGTIASGGITGWCLALLKRRIILGPAESGQQASLGVVFTPYTMYQLKRLPGNPPPETMYRCRGSNVWEQVFNPLNLPSHTIRTVPAGP